MRHRKWHRDRTAAGQAGGKEDEGEGAGGVYWGAEQKSPIQAAPLRQEGSSRALRHFLFHAPGYWWAVDPGHGPGVLKTQCQNQLWGNVGVELLV